MGRGELPRQVNWVAKLLKERNWRPRIHDQRDGPDCNVYSPMTNIEFAHEIQHPESKDRLEVNFERMIEYSRIFGRRCYLRRTVRPGLDKFHNEAETAAFVQHCGLAEMKKYGMRKDTQFLVFDGREMESLEFIELQKRLIHLQTSQVTVGLKLGSGHIMCAVGYDDEKEIFLCQDSYGEEELEQVAYSTVDPAALIVPYWKNETKLNLIRSFGKPVEGFLEKIIMANGEYLTFSRGKNLPSDCTQGANYEEKEANKEAFRKYLEASGDLDAHTKVPVALYEQNDKTSSATEFIQQKLGGPTVAEHEKLQAQVSDMQKRFNELSVAHQEQCMELEELKKKSHCGQVSTKNEVIDQNDEGVSE